MQPHSGSQANQAAYAAVLSPGDTIMGLNLAHGGHLSHGHPLNFSGKTYKVIPYGVRKEDERIDYDELARLAEEHQPKMIIAGASAYPRIIDFARFREVADAVGAVFLVDMAHISGLVAAGLHPNPCQYADIVTSTTHKTLRGPRAGIILAREKFGAAIDKVVFPGTQGGPLVHVMAAKAVCFLEALQPEFAEYQKRVVANAQALAGSLVDAGIPRGLRRHRHAPAAARRFLQGHSRQGGRKGPRPGAHHRQQERHPLRRQPAAQPQRHPPGIARRDHPRIRRTRDARDRRADRRSAEPCRGRRRPSPRCAQRVGALAARFPLYHWKLQGREVPV